jgi:hypothetical protein
LFAFHFGLLIGTIVFAASTGSPTAILAQEREGDRQQIERHRKEIQIEIGRREEMVAALKKKLTQLKDGQDKEAAEIKTQLDRVVAEMSKLRAELKKSSGDRERRDVADKRVNREQIVARLEKLRDVIAAAAKEGRHDEAEKLERQAHDLKAMLKRIASEADAEGDKRRGAEARSERDRPVGEGAVRDLDAARRARHLFTAAKNLHAAGMPDLAEKLQRQAEELAAHAGYDKRPLGISPEGRREKGDKPEGALAELAGELKALRREVEELRGQIKRLQGERGERR